MPRHAIAPHNGVCHEGVRGEDTGQEHRRAYPEAQQRHAYPHPQGERYAERQHPEHQGPRDVLLQVLQVHFKTGQEHDVIDAHLAEKLETAVPLEDVEPVLADDDTGQNHADDVRNAQAPQDDGSKENDHQHQEEYPGGVGNGQMDADIR